jgi:hypothetical protein
VIIVDRDVVGSFDPEATLAAIKDFDAEWKANTSGPLTTGPIGATDGNILQLDCPTVAYRELGPGDRDGIRTKEIGFGAHGDDAAFTLAFT